MDYKNETLGALSVGGKGSYGIGASAVDFSEDLYTYLRITDINDDGTLNSNDRKSVDDEKAAQYLLKENDIVFARTGASTGRNYFYDGTEGELVYAGFLIKFSIDPQKINPKYVKYYCQSTQYKNWVVSFNTGSTRGNINAQTFSNMVIPVPDRMQQDKAVSILEILDRKIQIARDTICELEEQAMILFRNYFVDFGMYNGVKPNEWKEGPLGEFVTIKRGGSPRPIQEYLSDEGLRWLKISAVTELNSPFVLDIKEHIKESGLKKTDQLYEGALVLSNSATPGIPKILAVDSCIHDGWLYFPESKLPKEYLYLFFKVIRKNLVAYGNGSVFTNLKTDILKNYVTFLPSKEVLDEFESLVAPSFNLMKSLSRQIVELQSIKTNLLQQIISGNIDLIDCDI